MTLAPATRWERSARAAPLVRLIRPARSAQNQCAGPISLARAALRRDLSRRAGEV